MNIKIYSNPRTLLENAGAGWLWDAVFIVIAIGLVLSFVIEIFKLQRGEKPNFWGVAWKSAIIIILYNFLPQLLESTLDFTSGAETVQELDSEFYNTLEALTGNLMMVQDETLVTPECPRFHDITLSNSGIKFLADFSLQYMTKLFIYILMLSIWTAKEVVYTFGWSTMMSLNTIALCAALTFPAFPNHGFASIGLFFKATAALILWPVLYSVFIFIISPAMVELLKNLGKSFTCPYIYNITRETVSAVSGLIFTGLGFIIIPFFAGKIVNSDEAKNAAAAIHEININNFSSRFRR